MGEYLELLLESLSHLEKTSDNAAFIEVNLAAVNLVAILGRVWVDKYV